MAEEDDSSKTEEPTAKRLQKAREQGQIVQSQEFKSWMMLLAGGLTVLGFAPYLMRRIYNLGRMVVESSFAIHVEPLQMRSFLADLSVWAVVTLGPIIGVLVLVAIVGNIAQSGTTFSPEKIKAKYDKVDPIKGLKKKFSVNQLMDFVKSILKLILVAGVALGLSLPFLADIAVIPTIPLVLTLDRIHILAIWLTVGTVAVMTVVAIADYIYQRYSFMKQMRMTKQEVKEEHRQSEGDPQVKAQIRKLRVQRARQRMMAAIPDADVVITNPTHFAVALQYDMVGMPAPKVVAKGMDSLAFRIREVAEAHEIPIVEDPPLARALYASVELDEHIPPEHYKAVAEIIGYVMRLRGEFAGAR